MAVICQKRKKSYCLFFRKMPYLKIGLWYKLRYGLKLTRAYGLVWVSIQHVGLQPTVLNKIAMHNLCHFFHFLLRGQHLTLKDQILAKFYQVFLKKWKTFFEKCVVTQQILVKRCYDPSNRPPIKL